MTITNLKDQLIRDEDEKHFPYEDSVGKLTIGVGRNLEDIGLSHEECMFLLDNDIRRAQNECMVAFPWFSDLSDARRGVVANMVFNMGLPTFYGFRKTIAYIEAKEWDKAADEMLDSKWAKQVGPRANRLSEQMRTDQWH